MSDILQPYEVIKLIEETSGKNAKKQIITNLLDNYSGNYEFFIGCEFAFDDRHTFGVKKVPFSTEGGTGLLMCEFICYLNKFISRELTGNAAKEAIAKMMSYATVDEWNYWYRRILIKDLLCGVQVSTFNDAIPDKFEHLRVFVFEAQRAEDAQHFEEKMVGEKIVQLKFDGVRVIIEATPEGEVTIYSRNGKVLKNFTNIEKVFKESKLDYLTHTTIFDGEIMSHSFRDLMTRVNRKSDIIADDSHLHLFDCLPAVFFYNDIYKRSQVDRMNDLDAIFRVLDLGRENNIELVESKTINLDTEEGQQQLIEMNTFAIENNYEGLMLKDPNAYYETRRTTSWLKMKPFIDVSLTIVGLEEGIKGAKGRLGAFVCEGIVDGVHVRTNVGSGITKKLSKEAWGRDDELIGQVIDVRADVVSSNKKGDHSLRFARFRGFEKGEIL